MTDLDTALAAIPRACLATLPTPLQDGVRLPGGARLLVKRDDLSGLGMGGNKARKLELLCGAALADGADVLVTVGAEQSNHARMTAAAGAILGIETHLVLGGTHRSAAMGNRLLGELFGAHIHQPATDDWAELSQALGALVQELRAAGRRPYAIPMGGSTEIGALGFTAAWCELRRQLDHRGLRPAAIVHASSTGGSHAGLLAGAAADADAGRPGPPILAVAVAKEPGRDLAADTRELAVTSLRRLGLPGDEHVGGLLELDHRWLGRGYARPSGEGDAAIRWAARRGAWVLDRTYGGKAFAGLLGADADGRFGPGDSVVFWHTGGQPAVFAAGGVPPSNPDDIDRQASEFGSSVERLS